MHVMKGARGYGVLLKGMWTLGFEPRTFCLGVEHPRHYTILL